MCLLIVRPAAGRLAFSVLGSPSAEPLGGMLLMTPVASHLGAKGNLLRVESTAYCPSLGIWVGLGVSGFETVRVFLLEIRGVPVGVPLNSRLAPMEPRGCRLVIPPRSFRISSTSWIPSGSFGFFGLIYRSRCRPREEEVKAWPQKGQLLSLGAPSLGVPASGVPAEGEAMVRAVDYGKEQAVAEIVGLASSKGDISKTTSRCL